MAVQAWRKTFTTKVSQAIYALIYPGDEMGTSLNEDINFNG